MAPHSKKARVGVGLSLEKLAKSRVSKYDKRAILEKQRERKLRRKSEYNRLKRKLEAEGAAELQTKYPDTLQNDPYEEAFGAQPPEAANRTTEPAKKKRSRQHPADDAADRPAASTDEEIDNADVDAELHTGDDIGQAAKQSRHQQHQHQGKQHTKQQSSKSKSQGNNQDQQQDVGQKGKHKHNKHQKPLSQLEAKAQRKRQAAEQEKQQAQQANEQARARIEQAEKQRRQQKQQFFKKTRTGQPVMKYRIDKILQQLQGEQA